MKKNTMLYLDGDTIKNLKHKGINISAKVNEFLTNLDAPTITKEAYEKEAAELLVKVNQIEDLIQSQEVENLHHAALMQTVKGMIHEELMNYKNAPHTLDAQLRRVKNRFNIDLTKEEFISMVD